MPGCGEYKFPLNVALTEKRPDMVMWSDAKMIIIIFELTVPAERNVLAAHTRKEERYGTLANECRKSGYDTHVFNVEVGVLGFIGDSMRRALLALGGKSLWNSDLRRKIEHLALRCSYAIYLQHKSSAWTPWRLYVPGRSQGMAEEEKVKP